MCASVHICVCMYLQFRFLVNGCFNVQGTCGSCWAFQTAAVVEGAHFLANGQLIDLSVQQLMDCDHQVDDELDFHAKQYHTSHIT